MSVFGVFSRPGASYSLKMLAATNIFGAVYFWVVFVSVIYLGFFHVIPSHFGHSPNLVITHFLASGFIAVNVIGNYFNVVRSDSSITLLDRFSKWKDKDFKLECSICKRGVPRRSHHCTICDTCVLKRDHHCFFMSTCIGYYNQKYFFMFCVYNTIGGVYGTVLLAIFMHLNYKVTFTGLTSFITLMPATIAGWWFRTSEPPPTKALLATVGLFYASLLGFLLSFGILLWQVYIVSQGQTTYEAKHGITKFTKSLKENFLDVFGKYWYISLFLPIMLPQKSDGTYMQKSRNGTSRKKAVSKKD